VTGRIASHLAGKTESGASFAAQAAMSLTRAASTFAPAVSSSIDIAREAVVVLELVDLRVELTAGLDRRRRGPTGGDEQTRREALVDGTTRRAERLVEAELHRDIVLLR
jgi:hypothetical protein